MGCAPSSPAKAQHTLNVSILPVSVDRDNNACNDGLDDEITTLKENRESPHARKEEENSNDYSLIQEDLEKIDSILDFLLAQSNYLTEEVIHDYLERLARFYDPIKEGEKTNQLSDYLAERYPLLYVTILNQLHTYNIFNWAVEDDIRALVCCYKATSVLWNTCDASSKMCREVGKAGIIAVLVEDMNAFKEYSTSTQTHKAKDIYLGSLLATMHNIVRNYQDNREYARDAGAVEMLQHYLGLEKILYRSCALLSLSYIVNEKENEKINTGNENIQFLVDLLKSAVETDNHRAKAHAFHTTELVAGMTKLAVNDANKVKFVELGILPPLFQLLQPYCTMKEQMLAAWALWSLSFKEENVSKIRNYKGGVDALLRLQHSSNPELREAIAGALWELRETSKVEKISVMSSNRGHVMISYNWDVQRRMIKMKDKLESEGYNVWMDIEQMGGSTLGAMADGVQGADVVLICMSEKYKGSTPCRSEAEFTYKLRKPFIPIQVQPKYTPDDWLGVMVGTKLYYDFCSESSLEDNFPSLVRGLGNQGKREQEVTATEAFTTGALPPTVTASQSQETTNKENVQSWNNDDVTTWLSTNELGHLKPKFNKYNGYKLLTMKKLSIEAPEYFYGSIGKQLGIREMYDVVTFKAALEELD